MHAERASCASASLENAWNGIGLRSERIINIVNVEGVVQDGEVRGP